MDEAFFIATAAWLTEAGIAGISEGEIISGFCARCVEAGLPLGRCIMFIDTLHPVHEGRLYQWDFGVADLRLLEYGRTDPDALAASGSSPNDNEALKRWRRSPFYRMLQTGETLFRLRRNAANVEGCSLLPDWLAAGLTDYVAIICRFAPEGIIGEMDGVYISYATLAAEGFSDPHIAALERLTPSLALAFKSAALQRMTTTLMETYLGRDAGQRVLSGRIVRGMSERIDAVIWFSIARIYAHHRRHPRTGDSAVERLCRRDRFDDPRARRRCGQTDRRWRARDLQRGRSPARLRCGLGRSDCGTQRGGRIERPPGGGQPAGNRHVSRPACRRGVLRKYRQP